MDYLSNEEIKTLLRNRGVPADNVNDRGELVSRLSSSAMSSPPSSASHDLPSGGLGGMGAARPAPAPSTGAGSTAGSYASSSSYGPTGYQPQKKTFSENTKMTLNQLKAWVTEGVDDLSGAVWQLWENGSTYLDNTHQKLIRDRYGLPESERILDEHRCKVVSGYTVINGLSHITTHFFCFSGWFGKNLKVVLPLKSIVQIHRGTAEITSPETPPLFRPSQVPDPSNNAIQLFTNDGRVHMFFQPSVKFDSWVQLLESSWQRVQTYGDKAGPGGANLGGPYGGGQPISTMPTEGYATQNTPGQGWTAAQQNAGYTQMPGPPPSTHSTNM